MNSLNFSRRAWWSWVSAFGVLVAAAWLLLAASLAVADDETTDDETATTASSPAGAEKAKQLGDPPGARRLSPTFDAWIDAKRKLVIIDGEVCLRRGVLEMFACTKGTKEHESVVSLNTQAFLAHAALLSLGAKTGSPVQFQPKYVPASGTEIEITMHWIDQDGKRHKAKAQDWIRNVKTNKAMTHGWVFAGSGFWTDPTTGTRYYQAEGGDFICVSNFPSAMLDLPIKSTQANDGLLFEAFTEKIPPLGTRVRMVLKVVGSKAVGGGQ